MSKIIGIDLGTTNSCVAVLENGEVKVIPNAEGVNTTPSIVGFLANGEIVVGQAAKRQSITNPEKTIYETKRLMGRKFDDKGLEDFIKHSPFKIVKNNSNGDAWVKVGNKAYSPQEIAAMVLSKMKKIAEDYLGEPVTEAIISVPAYFNDIQRTATQDAAKIAGLDVKRIINEPTAAALAYGIDKKTKNSTIVIFDTGGSTHDLSVLELGDGVFEVKATNGDAFLGGTDFDQVIINWLREEFKKESGIDLINDKMALQRLKESAEKAKIELSSQSETDINLPFITADASGPKHLNLKLSRAKLEQLTEKLIDRLFIPCETVLKDAGISKDKIDEVILVGGMTRMPKIQERVKLFFGKEPSKGVNPDEVVAIGAAIQGGVLQGKIQGVLLLDVTPLSLGIETMGGVFTKLIEKNTTIPTKKSQIFSTAADNQNAVTIHALQGEREFAEHNKSLGRFDLVGIPSAPRGLPQIEVAFDIDANGIVHVSAKDLGTGKEQSIKITAAGGLTKAEIKKMKQEADEHKEEDEKRKKLVDARNGLDSMVYTAEKTLRENGDKIDPADKSSLESALTAAKNLSSSDDLTAIEKSTQDLTTASHKMSEKLYKKQAEPQDQPTDESHDQDPNHSDPGKKDDDVIDAEFKQV